MVFHSLETLNCCKYFFFCAKSFCFVAKRRLHSYSDRADSKETYQTAEHFFLQFPCMGLCNQPTFLALTSIFCFHLESLSTSQMQPHFSLYFFYAFIKLFVRYVVFHTFLVQMQKFIAIFVSCVFCFDAKDEVDTKLARRWCFEYLLNLFVYISICIWVCICICANQKE